MGFLELSQSGDDLKLSQRSGARTERAINAGVRAVGRLMDERSSNFVENIYRATIPLSKNGNPRWKRTGNLKRGRSVQFPDNWTAHLAIHTGKAAEKIKNYAGGYAQRRHQLAQPTNQWGKGWTPHSPSGGVLRRNPFFEETEAVMIPRFERAFQDAYEKAFSDLYI